MQLCPGGEGGSVVADTPGDPSDVFQQVAFLDLVAAEVVVVEDAPLFGGVAGLGHGG